jgi:NADPH-dependent curcumin reductase CurA
MSQLNRRILMARHPDAEPTDDCFRTDEVPVPELADGEALVAVRHLSIDPAQRMWMNPGGVYNTGAQIGAPMMGLGFGEVVASRNGAYPVGGHVDGMFGWQQYAVIDSDARRAGSVPAGIDGPAALGVFGMNGQTAYWGLLDVGRPQPGETVLVSAAAGATGSLVGQLARIAGARVVGRAGSAEKRAWIRDELGFDEALDYRADSLPGELDKACPDGVHVYFDNVGGQLLDLALERLAMRGRVVLCGAIAAYNNNVLGPGPSRYRQLIRQRGRMEGFIVFDYLARYGEALAELRGWEAKGLLRHREDIVEGLDHAPEALRRVLRGDHFGKTIVAV